MVDWYNNVHRHCSIRFVTPQQRHDGMDAALLQNRINVYATARQANPSRWSGPFKPHQTTSLGDMIQLKDYSIYTKNATTCLTSIERLRP